MSIYTRWFGRPYDYPVVLQAQPEGGFVVTLADVPEAITQGEDEDEAML